MDTVISPPDAAGPVKRSITIAGHQTSISLEPIFWQALERAAAEQALPLSALVARIDGARIEVARPPNLASAIRTWLFARALTQGSAAAPDGSAAAGDPHSRLSSTRA